MIKFFPKVAIQVTNSCRMRCKFCCAFNDKLMLSKIERYKEQDNLLKIIKILGENDVKRICWSGGEALLMKGLGELLREATSLGMKNQIVSADGELAANFDLENYDISQVRFSIHGLGEEHDRISEVKGSFEAFYKGIENVKRSGIELGFSYVITEQNKERIEQVVNWCIEQRGEVFYLTKLMEHGKGEEFISENGDINLEEFNDIFREIDKKYGDKIRIYSHDGQLNLQYILIGVNGEVIARPYFGEENCTKKLGNILREEPTVIWERVKNDKRFGEYMKGLGNSSLYRGSTKNSFIR